MSREKLLRGVSAGAISLVCLAFWPEAASAQQSLPTINVGGSQKTQRIASAPRGKPTGYARATAPTRVASSGGGGNSVQAPPAETLGEKLDPDAPKSIWSPTLPDGRPAFVEKWHLPNTVASITRKQIETKINIVDTEDAVKYMPSLFVRKRNNGDTQAVLQTRTWGVNSSARSLVYADDLLLTALIANDNTQGAPRWGLVAPEEIERVDFLYGPYAAEYPGNSMGGVLKITTRMPEKPTATAKNITNYQDYSFYGTKRLYVNNVTQLFLGDKMGDFSWTVSGNWQRGSQQPLTYVTNAINSAAAVRALGAYPSAWFDVGRFNQPITVLGATGNLSNDQVNGKFKGAYDINATTRATYTLGFWSNDGTSQIQNYLVEGQGPYFGGRPGRTLAATPAPSMGTTALQAFGSGAYRVQEKMLTNAGAIKSNTNGLFDYELSASNFSYLQSNQNTPWSGAYPYGGWTQFGRTIKNGGTYWTLLDAKGILRPQEGLFKDHAISFGLHGDQFVLNNPTYFNYSWTGGESTAYGLAQTIAQGTTRTKALWFQDAFDIVPDLKFTTGLRAENWLANGLNQSIPGTISPTGFGYAGAPPRGAAAAAMPTYQPNKYSTRWSPKGSLEYKIDEKWTVNGNIGMANRFPTVKELYNLSFNTASGNNVNPNPNLRPEVALTKEVNLQRKLGNDGGTARLTLFDEEVRDAIVQQQNLVPGSSFFLTSANVNIDRIRNSGVEVALQKNDVMLEGLDMQASMTWVNSRIISDPTWAPSTTIANPLSGNYDSWCWSVSGKRMPYVPEWRGTYLATWHPDKFWSFTFAGRYQSKVFATLSNNDYATNTYQAFDGFLVFDIKAAYKYNDHFTFDFGVDNLNNYSYFLFHPFPQRTYYMSAKYELGDVKKGEPGIFANALTGGESGLPDIKNWVRQTPLTLD